MWVLNEVFVFGVVVLKIVAFRNLPSWLGFAIVIIRCLGQITICYTIIMCEYKHLMYVHNDITCLDNCTQFTRVRFFKTAIKGSIVTFLKT